MVGHSKHLQSLLAGVELVRLTDSIENTVEKLKVLDGKVLSYMVRGLNENAFKDVPRYTSDLKELNQKELDQKELDQKKLDLKVQALKFALNELVQNKNRKKPGVFRALHEAVECFKVEAKKGEPPRLPPSRLYGLTLDEVAAIHAYTQESVMYYILNKNLAALNKNNSDDEIKIRALEPFLQYMKLLLTALYKLPMVEVQVMRAVSMQADELDEGPYRENDSVTWWRFTSTTKKVKVLHDFLSEENDRSLLWAEVSSGVDISSFSDKKAENEIMLVPGTSLRVGSELKVQEGMKASEAEGASQPRQNCVSVQVRLQREVKIVQLKEEKPEEQKVSCCSFLPCGTCQEKPEDKAKSLGYTRKDFEKNKQKVPCCSFLPCGTCQENGCYLPVSHKYIVDRYKEADKYIVDRHKYSCCWMLGKECCTQLCTKANCCMTCVALILLFVAFAAIIAPEQTLEEFKVHLEERMSIWGLFMLAVLMFTVCCVCFGSLWQCLTRSQYAGKWTLVRWLHSKNIDKQIQIREQLLRASGCTEVAPRHLPI